MTLSPLELSLVLLAILAVPLARAYARIGDEQLGRWAGAHGLELTDDNRPVVARHLRRARVLRTWGAIAGLVVPSLVELAVSGRVVILGFGTDGSAAPLAGPFGAYVGYLLGAVGAEVSLARPMDGARRSASLVPRELDDYLPRRLLRAQRALGIVIVLGCVAIWLLPYDPRDAAEPGWLSLVTWGAVFGAFAAALEALERWLVRRRQPFTSPSLVAADDALRAQAVHTVAGGGLALLLISCSGVFIALAASDVAVLQWTMWLPALVALLLSLRACLEIGHRAWRVRRPVAGTTTTAPT